MTLHVPRAGEKSPVVTACPENNLSLAIPLLGQMAQETSGEITRETEGVMQYQSILKMMNDKMIKEQQKAAYTTPGAKTYITL